MIGPERSSLLRPTALLAIAAVIPLLIFATISAAFALRGEQAEARNRAIAEARRVSEAVDRELGASLAAVQDLADLPALDGPQPDVAAFNEVALRQQARHPLWLTVLLLDPQGRRLSNSRTPARLGAAVDPVSLAEAVRNGAPVVGPLRKGPQRYGLPVRAPVVRNGRVTAVVTVVMAPDRIRQALLASALPGSWIATVVDKRGEVVARSRHEERYLSRTASPRALAARASAANGVYPGRTLEGIATMSAFWVSPTSGWSVHIGVPRTEFDAPLRRSIAFAAAGLLLSVVLAAAFVALLLHESETRRREAAAAEQAHRLEALGRLTGGVAHDFNNLLMIIQGNAELIGRRVRDSAADAPLNAIRMATQRASRMTRELLMFARGGGGSGAPLDLNAAVGDFLGPLRDAVGPGVTVDLALSPAGPWIVADQVQLEMALLNLAVNARDAMEGAGLLEIASGADEGMAWLRVRDTGPGFSPNHVGRVFDPFFTTKAQSGGAGLGLTQVYSFARQSGGSVRIEPPSGAGAEIVLTLPRTAPAQAPAPLVAAAAPAASAFAGKRVVLVDDNAEVRAVSAHYLRELGAEVSEAEDGAAALGRLHAGRVDALISDIVMPGAVDGLVLAREAMQRWPGLPVLLISGYSASVDEARTEGVRVLAKPYELDALAAALAEILPAA